MGVALQPSTKHLPHGCGTLVSLIIGKTNKQKTGFQEVTGLPSEYLEAAAWLHAKNVTTAECFLE